MSIPFGAVIPFVDHLGFTLEKFEGGHSELRYVPCLLYTSDAADE